MPSIQPTLLPIIQRMIKARKAFHLTPFDQKKYGRLEKEWKEALCLFEVEVMWQADQEAGITNKPNLACKTCGSPNFTWTGGETTTLVGYFSPAGHNHDDNCIVRGYVCENGHPKGISKQNACSACNWVGKTTCRICGGEKVKEWPLV